MVRKHSNGGDNVAWWTASKLVFPIKNTTHRRVTVGSNQAINEGRPFQPSYENRCLSCHFDRRTAIANDLDPVWSGGGSSQLQATRLKFRYLTQRIRILEISFSIPNVDSYQRRYLYELNGQVDCVLGCFAVDDSTVVQRLHNQA
jgi:hypothetical protein